MSFNQEDEIADLRAKLVKHDSYEVEHRMHLEELRAKLAAAEEQQAQLADRMISSVGAEQVMREERDAALARAENAEKVIVGMSMAASEGAQFQPHLAHLAEAERLKQALHGVRTCPDACSHCRKLAQDTLGREKP